MALAISTSILSGDSKQSVTSQYLSPASLSLSPSSSFSDLSPLPSPHLRPKTSAFFATPTILPPPSPEPTTRSKNDSFFSSVWSPASTHADLPGPSMRPPARRSSSSSTTLSVPEIDLHKPSRTNTLIDSFFAPRTLPTPPPSSYSASASSRDPSPAPSSPKKSRLPPLSRFFPSRFGSDTRNERTLLDIDQTPRPTEQWSLDGALSVSPTQTDFPVSIQQPLDVTTPDVPVPNALPSPHRLRPLPRETLYNDEQPHLSPGSIVCSSSGRRAFVLEKELGQGAFSSVWLSRVRSSFHERALSGGPRVDHALEGIRPLCHPDTDLGEGEAATPAIENQLVAVKLTDRKAFETNDRTRVSFIREVEVLKHISHRNIVSYVASFTTPTYHCLALEYVGGGELFDLINSDETHACLDEPRLRRVFGELCKAVEFMHGVGLVHRDIKLENILLTSNVLVGELPSVKVPLLKLTDFGLSRFIDPEQPLLSTRCGSESYAAPELVIGSLYDGRQTDAWACGVVLFALAARQLPFDARPPGAPSVQTSKDRRRMLVKIANGEFTWPGEAPFATDDEADIARLSGVSLLRSPGVRRVVERLLVRDPSKRSTMANLWEDEWMWGDGAPVAPATASRSGSLTRKSSRLSRKSTGGRSSKRRAASPLYAEGLPPISFLHSGPSPLIQHVEGLPNVDMDDIASNEEDLSSPLPEDDPDAEVEVEEHGSLLDAGSIGEIARQELQ